MTGRRSEVDGAFIVLVARPGGRPTRRIVWTERAHAFDAAAGAWRWERFVAAAMRRLGDGAAADGATGVIPSAICVVLAGIAEPSWLRRRGGGRYGRGFGGSRVGEDWGSGRGSDCGGGAGRGLLSAWTAGGNQRTECRKQGNVGLAHSGTIPPLVSVAKWSIRPCHFPMRATLPPRLRFERVPPVHRRSSPTKHNRCSPRSGAAQYSPWR